MAFYGIEVPQDILVLDFADATVKSEENRDELNRLIDDRLVKQTVNKTEKEPLVLNSLHGFVLEAVNRNLNEIKTELETHLENLADQMRNKTRNAWENKLFYKQLALTECWEKLEDYLIQVKQRPLRQYQRDLVNFYKALASQEIAETFAVSLTDEQKKDCV